MLTAKFMFHDVYMWKESAGKDVSINNYELLNMQANSFHVCWNRDLLPISSGKL